MNTPHLTVSYGMRQEFELLPNEVGTLIYHFEEHEALFAHSKERINLLNETAPVFFRMVSDGALG